MINYDGADKLKKFALMKNYMLKRLNYMLSFILVFISFLLVCLELKQFLNIIYKESLRLRKS